MWPFKQIDEWGAKLEAGEVDEPTLALVDELRQERPLVPTDPQFQTELRHKLLTQPRSRWWAGGWVRPAAAFSLLALVILTLWTAPPPNRPTPTPTPAIAQLAAPQLDTIASLNPFAAIVPPQFVTCELNQATDARTTHQLWWWQLHTDTDNCTLIEPIR